MKAILFSTPMVQALLDGRITQTRRVIKPKYDNTHIQWLTNKYGTRLVEIQNDVEGETKHKNPDGTTTQTLLACREIKPKYQPGDILWVQETWRVHDLNPGFCMMIRFKADGGTNLQAEFKPSRYDKFEKYYHKNGWQSPYFMPREAARIFLRVTDVRAERLQEITPEDCAAEGIYRDVCHYNGHRDCNCMDDYVNIWDALYAKRGYGWDANPWVWIYTFEQCDKPRGA